MAVVCVSRPTLVWRLVVYSVDEKVRTRQDSPTRSRRVCQHRLRWRGESRKAGTRSPQTVKAWRERRTRASSQCEEATGRATTKGASRTITNCEWRSDALVDVVPLIEEPLTEGYGLEMKRRGMEYRYDEVPKDNGSLLEAHARRCRFASKRPGG